MNTATTKKLPREKKLAAMRERLSREPRDNLRNPQYCLERAEELSRNGDIVAAKAFMLLGKQLLNEGGVI